MIPVAIFRAQSADYPAKAPFHPDSPYPEIVACGIREVDPVNHVYAAVRQTLALMGLDAANFGTPAWNPLRAYIRRGANVVVKPNFVLHEFGNWVGSSCITTHGSVIRAMLDYVFLAVGPEGRITVADAPIQGADFELLAQQSGIPAIQDFYHERLNFAVHLQDLRQVRAVIDEQSSLIREVRKLGGDPRGYRVVDMAADSRLKELDRPGTRYVVGDYDDAVTNTRHGANRHEYVISNTILEADMIVNLPKLKTHSKVGVTVCLKNLIGIIGSKDSLPHHRHGRAGEGGDEFPGDYPTSWLLSSRAYSLLQGRVPASVWRLLRNLAQRFLRAGTPINGAKRNGNSPFFPSGGWYGNDTIWRTVDDLNRVLFLFDAKRNEFSTQRQRQYFTLVDGIVSMEGNGPLRGTPKPSGVLLAGSDPLGVDVVAATLMGFDWHSVAMLKGIARAEGRWIYSGFSEEKDVQLLSNIPEWRAFEGLRRSNLPHQAPAGWQQHVELPACS